MNHYLKRYDVYLDHYKVALDLSSVGCETTREKSHDQKVTNSSNEQDRRRGECQKRDNHSSTLHNGHSAHKHMSGDCIDMSTIQDSSSTVGILNTDTDIHCRDHSVECCSCSEHCASSSTQLRPCSTYVQHTAPSVHTYGLQQDVNNRSLITECHCNVCSQVGERRQSQDQSFSVLTASHGHESGNKDSFLGIGSANNENGYQCYKTCGQCSFHLDKRVDTSVNRSDISIESANEIVDKTDVCECSFSSRLNNQSAKRRKSLHKTTVPSVISQENVTYNVEIERVPPSFISDSPPDHTPNNSMHSADIFMSSFHVVHTCPSDCMVSSFTDATVGATPGMSRSTLSTDTLDEAPEDDENATIYVDTSRRCGCPRPARSEGNVHKISTSALLPPKYSSPSKQSPSKGSSKSGSPNVKSSSASSFLFSMSSLRRRKKSKKKSSKVAPSASGAETVVTSPKLKEQQKVLLDNCNSDSDLNMHSLHSVDMDIRLKVPQFESDSRLGRLEKEFQRVMRVEEDGGLSPDWYYHCQTFPNRKDPKAKHMSIGRKKFNMDPKKGIEYLIEHGLLENTPRDIASFLHKGEGLNKTAIGDYLGEKNDFNIDVLKEFVQLHEFDNMILVQALRMFLWSFRLPGEAQKIDRMMECFAQRYCDSNPEVFTSTDTCYVLSFAIIMLNTSLHNPSVKDKPNVDRFISMNRGIHDGGDLPVELLTSIYDSIKKEPFKFPEDDGNDLMHTFFNPDKEGWLWKQGGRYKNWKRRWFILNDNCLYYFEFTADKEPKGIIPLENIQVKEVSDAKKPHCFELSSVNNEVIKACKTDSEGKVVEGKHHVYRMSASKAEEKDEWIKCIRASISENPFYDMLAARRKKAQQTNKNRTVKK